MAKNELASLFLILIFHALLLCINIVIIIIISLLTSYLINDLALYWLCHIEINPLRRRIEIDQKDFLENRTTGR